MMFDAMCRAAERHIPELERKLRYASLLLMPATDLNLEGPTESETDSRCRDLIANFRLPWKAVVVERSTQQEKPIAVFVERAGVRRRDGSINNLLRSATSDIGMEDTDVVNLAVTFHAGNGIAWITLYVQLGMPGGELAFDMNNVRVVEEDSAGFQLYDLRGFLLRAEEASGKGSGSVWWTWLNGQGLQGMYAVQNAIRPGRWILKEASNKRFKDPRYAAKVPRSHQRPHWLLITDEERVRYFRNDPAPAQPGEKHEVTPHPRRAHYRHIGENEDGSKKYTWVRACWVGSTEAEIRGARYKVELDL